VNLVHIASANGGSHVRHVPRVTPRSARTARTWAAELVGDNDNVLLAISELVTNVTRYAPGPARLSLRQAEDGIEVAVADRTPGGIPDPVAPGEDGADHGWGLFLLAAMSVSGPVIRPWPGGGKEVSFTFPVAKEPPQ
jgi:anti-sigma regulatory factor (Ser/Thr protein kinase)